MVFEKRCVKFLHHLHRTHPTRLTPSPLSLGVTGITSDHRLDLARTGTSIGQLSNVWGLVQPQRHYFPLVVPACSNAGGVASCLRPADQRIEGHVDVETAIVRQVRREANIGDLDSRMFVSSSAGRQLPQPYDRKATVLFGPGQHPEMAENRLSPSRVTPSVRRLRESAFLSRDARSGIPSARV